MEQKELICIGCPLGCNLTVQMDGNTVVSVSGNTCKRGDDYARKEMTDPRRIVTSTVRVTGGALPVVSVKTASDIPKNKINECLVQLKDVEIPAPVKIGDVVLQDAAGTGISVIATKAISTV
jgi:CxxC motif-containing protein